MKIKHKNIVLFVGYCADTQVQVLQQGVKNIFAETREKLLCFKYLRNGSLSNHLTGMINCGINMCSSYSALSSMSKHLEATFYYYAFKYLTNL
jgi:hypothetical protein